MDELQLKKNEQGEVLQVITTTSTETEEIPLSSTELQRQLVQQQAVVAQTQAQLNAVIEFEESEDTETTVTL